MLIRPIGARSMMFGFDHIPWNKLHGAEVIGGFTGIQLLTGVSFSGGRLSQMHSRDSEKDEYWGDIGAWTTGTAILIAYGLFFA